MNLLVQSLAETCKSHLLTEKWLIAPSLRAGHQWVDCVARMGQPAVNVHVQTVGGLAIALSKSRLTRTGMSRLTSQGAVILVDRILNRMVQQGSGYFTSSQPSLSLSRRIFYSIRDLRLAGLDPRSIDPDAFESVPKGQEICRIMQEYAQELRDLKLADYADEIDLATESLNDSPGVLGNDVLVVVPQDIDAGLALKERLLLESIPADKKVVLRVDSPERFPHDRPTDNAILLRGIREPAKAPAAVPNDRTVSIFNAVGEVNEVREVFRRCLAQGIPLDEVEVLYSDRNAYVQVIYEVALRLKHESAPGPGTMATFDEGIPATYSRPGKALTGWTSWIRDGFRQSTFLKMLEEDVLKMPGDPSDVERLLAVRIFRSAKIGFGESRYVQPLERLANRYEDQLKAFGKNMDDENDNGSGQRALLENKDRAATSLCGMVKLLVGLTIPQTIPAKVKTPSGIAEAKKEDQLDVLKNAALFLGLFVRVTCELDEEARKSLLAQIRNLASMVLQWGPLNIDMFKWLGNLSQEVRIQGSSPKPGAVYVAGIENGGHSGRRHTFIVGLDDGRFPSAGMQDPVILDSERENISRATSQRIPTARDGASLQLEKFAHLFARLSGSVTLSYSCKSIADDREMFPSPVLLSAYRIISQNRSADINDLVGSLRPPVSFAPLEGRKSLDMNEWWLNKLCAFGTVQDSNRLLRTHFPHLAQGQDAALCRESPDFTIYDGRIEAPDKSLDPTEDVGPRLSVSRLETLGTCPRHYFFGHVLGIERPEDVSVDKDTWLDNAQFGTLAHDVFYEFVAQIRDDHWPPDPVGDLNALLDIARNKAQRERRNIEPPSEAVFQRQFELLVRTCKTFLAHESRQADTKPCFLEAAIGLKSRYGQGTPLDSVVPVVVGLPGGKSVRLGGRIDRIDCVESVSPEQYVIYDYKTGSSYKFRSKDVFWCGRSVQHGIYIHLVQQALEKQSPGSQVSRFTYFFPGIKEDGLLISYRSHQISDIRSVLQSLCNMAANGAFICTNKPGTDCTYCPYPEICGTNEVIEAQASAKLGNLNEPKLHDLRELRNREP